MVNQYLGEFIAYGKTFHYKTQLRNKRYTKDETLKIYNKIYDLVAENLRNLSLRLREENYLDGNEDYSIISMTFFSASVKDYMMDKMFNSTLSFSEIYNKAINEFIKNPEQNVLWGFASKDKKAFYMEQIIDLKDRIVKQINRLVLHHLIENIDENIIIDVNHFEKEYLYNLPNNVVGFVCRNYDNHMLTRELGYAYEIPIVATTNKVYKSNEVLIDGYKKRIYLDPNKIIIDQALEMNQKLIFNPSEAPKYESKIIKFYANIVDKRGIDQAKLSTWYSGVASFRTEYMYITKGCLPTKQEQIEMYTYLLESFKDRLIHIRIPDFNDLKKLDYEKDLYTEIDYIRSFQRIYQDHISAIAEASKITNKKITIVVPMIRIGNEIDRWKDLIDAYVDYSYKGDIRPNVGVMMETESAFNYFEDYRHVDSVIFGLNDFLEESLEISRYEKIDKEDFMREAWHDLAWSHQYFRKANIKLLHIVSGNVLKQKEILNKFIKKGFKHFAIPLSYIKIAEEVLYKHESTRGSHVGIYAKRQKDKLNK